MTDTNDQTAYSSKECASNLRARADIPVPMRDVEDKVAFITGGDSGIGLGIAHALLNAGMKVVITYLTTSHLDEAMIALGNAGKRLHIIRVDVADRAAVSAAAEETLRVFGKVHVLVNNAGVFPMVSLSSATFDDWDWCIGVNVNGVFNGVHAFLPYIKAHGEGGHIVATSSIDGLVVGRVSQGVYATTKFAVVGMMEALRTELARINIGVSVFCPGGVNSNILNCNRNRPAGLGEMGTPDAEELALMEDCIKAAQSAVMDNGGILPMMDSLEAGEHVLQGIRNNDLYIIPHREIEQALRDRSEALLASLPSVFPTRERLDIARIMRNSIYVNELNRQLVGLPHTG